MVMIGKSISRHRPAIAWFLLACAFGMSARARAETARPSCDAILPAAGEGRATLRLPDVGDLIGLRDIGYAAQVPTDQALSLSPDGREAAFVLYRADPAANGYCVALVIIPTMPGGHPRVVDTGGELILAAGNLRGLHAPQGFPAVLAPKWSPDGRWIAYLKRVDGVTQVWRGRPDGSQATMTHAPVDVDLFGWSAVGDTLLFADRPGFAKARAAVDHEGLTGYLFDDRATPYASPRPGIPLPIPYAYRAVSLATNAERPATDAESRRLSPPAAPDSLDVSALRAHSDDGRDAWTAPRDRANWFTPFDLWAVDRSGIKRRCEAAPCTGRVYDGVQKLWWAPDGSVLMLSRVGWDKSQTGLFRWIPGEKQVRPILVTDDAITNCEQLLARLICTRDSSLKPRRIVSLDMHSGRSTTLFDPNPAFGTLLLGPASRLYWRNRYGLECYGDLVLPPGYRGDHPLPLIIVQYRTRGFLRGGTGDEYPIQVFAAHGYAVLSLEAPPDYYFSLPDLASKSWDTVSRENAENWHERKNKLSSITTAVEMLIAKGIVDPARIGITGLSDGATNVRFALINAPGMFAAASISTCCFEGRTMFMLGGPRVAHERERQGYPPALGVSTPEWKPASLALNADTVKTPILMQLADEEYILGLEAWSALSYHDDPVEMDVFPGEHHIKWQPAHRAAIYRRNIQWFDFWLRGRQSPSPLVDGQYARWNGLKAKVATHSN